jgi:hypothetical protein
MGFRKAEELALDALTQIEQDGFADLEDSIDLL